MNIFFNKNLMCMQYVFDRNSVQSDGLQQSIESQPQAFVHFILFLKQVHLAVLHFVLQEQVTSSRQDNGTGGSLVH